MNKYHKFLFMGLSGLALLSVLRFSGSADNWIIDLFSQFPFQYGILAFILFIICLWRKGVSLAIAAALLVLLNLSALLGSGGGVHAARQAAPAFNIYSANTYIHNKDLSKLSQEVRDLNPDIVLLMEVTPERVDQIRPLMQTYPYRIENTSVGEHKIGFVFLSKFPVLNHHVTKLSEWGNALLEAMLEIDQKPVMFYGMHAQRPDRQNFSERKSQFLWLAQHINKQTLPVIVAGDLNSTPFSPVFRQLCEIADLRDSRSGFGWQPSWPTYLPLLWIPIDHILVGPDIQVINRTTGSHIGSDHYPVFAELSIN